LRKIYSNLRTSKPKVKFLYKKIIFPMQIREALQKWISCHSCETCLVLTQKFHKNSTIREFEAFCIFITCNWSKLRVSIIKFGGEVPFLVKNRYFLYSSRYPIHTFSFMKFELFITERLLTPFWKLGGNRRFTY